MTGVEGQTARTGKWQIPSICWFALQRHTTSGAGPTKVRSQELHSSFPHGWQGSAASRNVLTGSWIGNEFGVPAQALGRDTGVPSRGLA